MAGHDIAINGAGLFKITRGVILKVFFSDLTLDLLLNFILDSKRNNNVTINIYTV